MASSTSEFPIRFRVATRATGKRRSVLVVVHETIEELQRVAALTDRQPGAHDNAAGVCHVGDYDTDVLDFVPIVIRFHRGCVYTEIVAHEATHAAAELIWADIVGDLKHPEMGRYMTNTFEPLAYAVGELTQRIVTRCFEYGLVE